MSWVIQQLLTPLSIASSVISTAHNRKWFYEILQLCSNLDVLSMQAKQEAPDSK